MIKKAEFKCCTGCNITYPRNEEYFFKNVIKKPLKNGSIGSWNSFQSICKKCSYIQKALRHRKKRCLEMGCELSQFEEFSKEKMAEKLRKDPIARNKLTLGQYRNFLSSGEKDAEAYLKRLEENIVTRDKRITDIAKGKRKYFTDEERRSAMRQYSKNQQDKVTNSYVVNSVMNLRIGDVSKEIIETKRLVIQLKRELNIR
jgi:hypothetical protein